MTVNEALIPTGTEPVTGIYDLNDGPTLEGRAFDDAWVDVERAADGTTTTTFTRPDGIEVKKSLAMRRLMLGSATPPLAHRSPSIRMASRRADDRPRPMPSALVTTW